MTNDRTEVSKRTRFAVLARDGYTCRYCGRHSAVTPLRVDHVVPIVLGGGNDPTNLVTACEDCNMGKGDQFLETHEQSEDVEWAAAVWLDALTRVAAQIRSQRETLALRVDSWAARWNSWGVPDPSRNTKGRGLATEDSFPLPLPHGWRTHIERHLQAGADLDVLIYLIDVAMTSNARNVFHYFHLRAGQHVRATYRPAPGTSCSTGTSSTTTPT